MKLHIKKTLVFYFIILILIIALLIPVSSVLGQNKEKPNIGIQFQVDHNGNIKNYQKAPGVSDHVTFNVELILINNGTANATNVSVSLKSITGKILSKIILPRIEQGYHENIRIKVVIGKSAKSKVFAEASTYFNGTYYNATTYPEYSRLDIVEGVQCGLQFIPIFGVMVLLSVLPKGRQGSRLR